MNATKEKGRDSSAPTAAAIREIKVSRVEFKPPPKKRKNAGDDVRRAGKSRVLYVYYNARKTPKTNLPVRLACKSIFHSIFSFSFAQF